MSIPIVSADQRSHDAALVEIPLVELASRMSPFDAQQLAFYTRGRTPTPHALVDLDGDARPDHAQLAIPVAGDGSTRILAVCPGPRASEPFRGGAVPRATPDFHKATR